jgi:transposase InsO family protein
MCQMLAVSRSGYYDWLGRDTSPRKLAELKLARTIEDVHKGSRQTYGSPRVCRALKAMGHSASEGRVARTMRKYGIRAKTKRKFRPRTTESNHNLPVAPNRLARDFNVQAENRVWVADITYVPTREGWLYLATVMDLYSRKIVGWAMNDRMPKELALDALRMAYNRRSPPPGLLHHSDRGCQYASGDYRTLLAKHGSVASMSRKGNCWDNAPMESFFHTLKTEHIFWEDYATRRQAQQSIFWWIEAYYNRERLHSAIDYRTPEAYERESA